MSKRGTRAAPRAGSILVLTALSACGEAKAPPPGARDAATPRTDPGAAVWADGIRWRDRLYEAEPRCEHETGRDLVAAIGRIEEKKLRGLRPPRDPEALRGAPVIAFRTDDLGNELNDRDEYGPVPADRRWPVPETVAPLLAAPSPEPRWCPLLHSAHERLATAHDAKDAAGVAAVVRELDEARAEDRPPPVLAVQYEKRRAVCASGLYVVSGGGGVGGCLMRYSERVALIWIRTADWTVLGGVDATGSASPKRQPARVEETAFWAINEETEREAHARALAALGRALAKWRLAAPR